MSSFTAADLPAQTGRVALVTGGNGSLGQQTVLALARAGAKVYLCARNAAKAVRLPLLLPPPSHSRTEGLTGGE